MPSRFLYFVAVSPGLEQLLEQELRSLDVEAKVMPGGVECRGDPTILWTIVHRSRLAESVRLRLRPFPAVSFGELERGLERLPWHAYLTRGAAFDVSVACQGSRLYHTKAIAQRVRRVISARWGEDVQCLASDATPTQRSSAEQLLYVRVTNNMVQISVGASSERLHRRGYRTHVGQAPLRETLAAATIRLLMARAPERGLTRLWDPCCGSGTILAEWLLQHSSSATNAARHFAFEQWPVHDRQTYATWLAKVRGSDPEVPSLMAYGSDRDARVIGAAQHNLELAGVLDRCELFAQDFRAAECRIPKDTAVIANLPYGVRLQDRATATRVFAALDGLLQRRTDLRPALVLSTLALSGDLAQRWQPVAEFANGGLRVRALTLTEPEAIAPHCGIVVPAADCPRKTARTAPG